MKNKNENSNSPIAPKVNINKVHTTIANYKLNKSHDWVRNLLIELNEKVSDLTEETKLEQTELSINFDIQKMHRQEYGDFVVVHGQVEGQFLTECVKTLQMMKDMVHIKLQACFLSDTFQDDEQFADQTEVFINNGLYELYFYTNDEVDIGEMFHEQIFLNITAYPTLESDETLN